MNKGRLIQWALPHVWSGILFLLGQILCSQGFTLHNNYGSSLVGCYANHVCKKTSFSHAKVANELPCWKLNYNKIFMQNIPIFKPRKTYFGPHYFE
jgi:hypothetical protein